MGMVFLIRPDNFTREVVSEKKPVLILCMPRNEDFLIQLELLEEIAIRHGQEVKVGVLEEDSLEAFKKTYAILGDPTFLILVEGKEVSRILGLADEAKLRDFIMTFNRKTR